MIPLEDPRDRGRGGHDGVSSDSCGYCHNVGHVYRDRSGPLPVEWFRCGDTRNVDQAVREGIGLGLHAIAPNGFHLRRQIP